MYSVLNHSRFEFGSIIRHPEQLLLLIGTPIAVLILLQEQIHIFQLALAICIMSSNFTSIAINTAFARRYGTLKYLAVSPVGKSGIWIAQFLVGLASLIIQLPILLIGTRILDKSFETSALTLFAIPILIAFNSSLAFLFSTIMSAEKVLAFANVFFIAVAGTGVYFSGKPFSQFHPVAGIVEDGIAGITYLLLYTFLTAIIFFINVKRFRWID